MYRPGLIFIAALVAATGAAVPAVAHDVWLQPATFVLPAGGVAPITIFVGHAEARQRWGVATKRITRFDDIHAGKAMDRRGELDLSAGSDDARLRFDGAGTHVLAMVSDDAFSELPPIRFNDFVAVEGLTKVAEYRVARGLGEKPGRERYSRRAKALVRVGPADTAKADLAVTRPVGFDLEIVPLHDPYTVARTATLPVQVLHRGKPLAGALVKLTNLDFDAQPVAVQRTDAGGRASFQVPRQGKWLLNTIWSVPVAGDPKADFETIFSSLTFGFAGTGPRPGPTTKLQ
jgi:uncharacterized GH25 family protein